MYFNDIAINFAIVLSPDIEFFVNLYVLEFYVGGFVHNKDNVSESVEDDVDVFLLVNHESKELIKVFAILFH